MAQATAHAHSMNPARQKRAGFTLLEVVVAMAIIGMVAGLVVVNFSSAFEGFKSRPPEDVFRTAVRQARYEAALRRQKTFLSFDAEKNTFFVIAADGTPCGEYPLGRDTSQGRFEVIFTPYRPDQEMEGQENEDLSEYPIARLIFDPSGCAIPVKVQIKGPSESAEMTIDPFSWGPPPKRQDMEFKEFRP